ncbi:MAG: aa3-type cytochrome c oxidase subunit IV [Kiloniellales bacterium]
MPADFDIEPHVKTWHGFLKLLGFSVAGVVILLLILMAAFLT